MLNSFLLQVDDEGQMSIDTNTVYHAIKQRNWTFPEEPVKYALCHFNDLPTKRGKDYLPVGSIEFVEAYLSREFGISSLLVTLIPKPLQTKFFLSREVTSIECKDDLFRLLSAWDTKALFVKSASKTKCDYADIYTEDDLDRVPPDARYFVSEVLNMRSEWRVFVSNGKPVDIRCYSGDPWRMPCRTFIDTAIEAVDGRYPAFTLDVGVLRGGETVVIEVHNFVSCGLYGAALPFLLSMVRAGIRSELDRSKQLL